MKIYTSTFFYAIMSRERRFFNKREKKIGIHKWGKSKMNQTIGKTVLCSALMSVSFTSAVFLSNIVSVVNPIFAIVYLIIVAAFYAGMLISETGKIIFVKWMLSLPISFVCFQYFWKTHYSIRALNWMLPDYGNQSAGGNFAGSVMLIIQLVLCLFAVFVAVSVKPWDYRKFEKIQLVSGIVFGIVNVITVVILEMQFPSYQTIMQYINS